MQGQSLAIFLLSVFLLPWNTYAGFYVREFHCVAVDDDTQPVESVGFLFGKMKDNGKFEMSQCKTINDCQSWFVLSASSTEKAFDLKAERAGANLSLQIRNELIFDEETYAGSLSIREQNYKAACGIKYVSSKDVHVLMKEFESDDFEIKLKALEGLKALKEEASLATKVLIKALQHVSSDVRDGAAEALGAIGGRASEAIIALIIASGDENYGVHLSASMAVREIIRAGQMPDKTIPEITEFLKHKNPKVRAQAADSLGIIGPKAASAVTELISCISDSDQIVQGHCMRAIGQIGPAAISALLPLMEVVQKSLGANLSTYAAASIELIGPAPVEHLDALMEYLNNADYLVLKTTIGALGKMGIVAEKAVPAIVSKMNKYNMVDHAIKALEQIGVVKAIPYLVELLQNSEVERLAQIEVIFFVGNITPKATQAVPVLIALADDADGTVRLRVIQALGEIGPLEKVLATIVKASKDKYFQVRAAAATAIGNFGSAAAKAIPVLIDLLGDEDQWVVAYTIRALGNMGALAAPAVSKLIPILKDKKQWDSNREDSARTLGLIGLEAKEAVPALKAIINDETEKLRLRQIAQWALEQILN